jgi:hypothetical protein
MRQTWAEGEASRTVIVSQTSTEVLDQCRQAVATEAGHLGGAGDSFPDGGRPRAAFGRLAASAAMAGAVDALDRRMHADFEAAERLLLAVERAIGSVEASVLTTDRAAATGLSGTAV